MSFVNFFELLLYTFDAIHLLLDIQYFFHLVVPIKKQKQLCPEGFILHLDPFFSSKYC